VIFWLGIGAAGFAGGYFLAAGYGQQLTTGIGAAIKKAELDILGLGDDTSDTNQSSAGSP
jgi:hypothetical protein